MYQFLLKFLLCVFGLYLFGVLSAMAVNARKKYKDFDGIPYKSCFNPIKWLSFVLGWAFSFIPLHVIEQFVLRFYDENCGPCIRKNECEFIDEDGNLVNNCGCPPHQKACSPFEECEGNYGPIIWNKEDYEKSRISDKEGEVGYRPIIKIEWVENK